MKKSIASACLPVYSEEWWQARLGEAEARGSGELAKVESDRMHWILGKQQLPPEGEKCQDVKNCEHYKKLVKGSQCPIEGCEEKKSSGI